MEKNKTRRNRGVLPHFFFFFGVAELKAAVRREDEQRWDITTPPNPPLLASQDI